MVRGVNKNKNLFMMKERSWYE